MGHQNTLELNGKHYDALTGRLLNSSADKLITKKINHLRPGKVLDGFTKRPAVAANKKVTRPAHISAQSIHKKTEHAKTLMRNVVKKPSSALPGSAHLIKQRKKYPVQKPTGSPQSQANLSLLSHAKKIKKSHLITKFGNLSGVGPSPTSKIATLPVHPAPAHEPAIVNLTQHAKSLIVSKDAFGAALARASSHEQPRLKSTNKLHHRVARKLHVKPRTINVAASLIAILLIAGFIAYQNVPNIAMRIATTRSGVHGNLPSYHPAGFALKGPIEYKPGQITISFKSNSDDRHFKVVQESSAWNSETLLANIESTTGKNPTVLQKQGKTIYIYDNDNAAWVTSGIKYQIKGNSSLNTDQLLRLAGSL